MKLYVTPGSPYARMARIVVIEKGLASRVEIITAKTRTTGSPYYGINPSGRVPYLVRDDGVGMEESALVCEYLDRLDGKPAFQLDGWEARRLEGLARSYLDGLSVWRARAPAAGRALAHGDAMRWTEPRGSRTLGARDCASFARGSAQHGAAHARVCAWHRASHAGLGLAHRTSAARRVVCADCRSALVQGYGTAAVSAFYREAGSGPGVVCIRTRAVPRNGAGSWTCSHRSSMFSPPTRTARAKPGISCRPQSWPERRSRAARTGVCASR